MSLCEGTYFSLIDTRRGKEVRPPPQLVEEEDANSDDELIGIFDNDDDDEELGLDESADDDGVDQDLVVSTPFMIYSSIEKLTFTTGSSLDGGWRTQTSHNSPPSCTHGAGGRSKVSSAVHRKIHDLP